MDQFMEYGRLQVTNRDTGSSAYLICSHPYTLLGNSTYVCGNRGFWRGTGYCGIWYFYM